MSKPELSAETVDWDYVQAGRTTSIPVTLYDNIKAVEEARQDELVGGDLPVIYLAGYGEREKVLQRAVAQLGARGIRAVAPDLPFDLVPPERRAIEAVCAEVPHLIGDSYRASEGVGPYAPMTVIGHSQGGGIASIARRHWAEGVGDMALWAPVGFDRLEEDLTPEDRRIASFIGRMLVNAATRNPFDPNNWRAASGIVAQAAYDLRTGRFQPKVGYAVSVPGLVDDLHDHAAMGNRVAIFAGKGDRVFRINDIEDNLDCSSPDDGCDVELIETSGGHESPITWAGRRQLDAVADWLLESR